MVERNECKYHIKLLNYARKVKRDFCDIVLQNLWKIGGLGDANRELVKESSFRSYGNELCIEIASVFENKNGIVSIISDDGDYETSVKLNELSGKFGIPISVAGSVRNVSSHIKHWRNLLREGNIELINHSYNHYRMDDGWEYGADKKRFIHEIIHAERFFRNRFGIEDKVFVCPGNAMNEVGYKVLREDSMVAVRRGERGVNSLCPSDGIEPGDWYNLKCYGIMDNPENSESRKEMRLKWLENAKGHWLIEMWHNVDVDGYQMITQQEAQNHLNDLKEFVKTNDLWAAKFTDAVKYLKGKENAELYSWKEDNRCYVVAICNIEGLDFSQELTINYTNNGIKSTYNILPNILYVIDNDEIVMA